MTPPSQRWPDVPDVYGWLALDRRGHWLLRNPARQSIFERFENPSLNAYISDNYDHDARGCWYVQNGPQRVYVHLHCTPLVFRFEGGRWRDHCGRLAGRISAAWLDEEGGVILRGERGAGLVDDRDLRFLAEMLVSSAGAATYSPGRDPGMLLRCDNEEGQVELLSLQSLCESSYERVLGFVADPRP